VVIALLCISYKASFRARARYVLPVPSTLCIIQLCTLCAAPARYVRTRKTHLQECVIEYHRGVHTLMARAFFKNSRALEAPIDALDSIIQPKGSESDRYPSCGKLTRLRQELHSEFARSLYLLNNFSGIAESDCLLCGNLYRQNIGVFTLKRCDSSLPSLSLSFTIVILIDSIIDLIISLFDCVLHFLHFVSLFYLYILWFCFLFFVLCTLYFVYENS